MGVWTKRFQMIGALGRSRGRRIVRCSNLTVQYIGPLMNEIAMLGRIGISALTLGVYVAPGIAFAQVGRCEIRELQHEDEKRLIIKARERLPPNLELSWRIVRYPR